MWKIFCQKTAIKITYKIFFQKIKKRTLDNFLWKLDNFLWKLRTTVRWNALQEAVGHSHLKMCCFLLRSVGTHNDIVNLVNFCVEY